MCKNNMDTKKKLDIVLYQREKNTRNERIKTLKQCLLSVALLHGTVQAGIS